MSETVTSTKAAKANNKKRNILIALAAITLFTWGKALFAGDGKDDAYARAKAAGTPTGPTAPVGSAGSGAGVAATASLRGTISTFQQARQRMSAWPDALDRNVIQGPIAEVLPFNTTLEPPKVEDPNPEPIDWSSGSISFEGLGLRLTSTAIFGKDRWAVINGQTVREGGILQLQVSGVGVRYVLEAVRPRAVDLREGEELHTLEITVGD